MSEWFKDSRGSTIPLIRIGKVIDNTDADGTGKLLVRMDGTDKLDDDQNLIPAYPLIPKFLNIYPEVGEAVFIFEYEYKVGLKTVTKSKRYWIGPIISQLQNLEKDEYKSAISQEVDGWSKPSKSLEKIKKSKGAYPNKKDIAIQGRDNADILFKSKEVQIRAGKFSSLDNLEFNKKDPAYIQLKYGSNELKKEFVDVTTEKSVFSPPSHLFKAVVKSSLPNGILLENDLSSEEYEKATIHKVSFSVKDLNNNTIIYSFDNGDNSYNSRGAAVQALIKQIDSNLSKYMKWKLKTPTSELLDKYGQQGQLSKTTKTVIYPNNTTTKKETKKVLKVKKVVTSTDSSVINVVASKINFISHDGEHTFDLTDNKELITSETQNKINSEAHPLVYGDKLLEFLELVKEFISNHTHPWAQDPPVDSGDKTNALEFDLQSILNKNINSN